MAAAFALGCAIAGIYRFTRGRPGSETLNLMATLVLLTILICMITLVVGDNVARAFSLAGALAIVRFRTVVEDTRDTAFVIFAVAVGMALGAGYLIMPLVCMPFAAVAAHLFRPAGERRAEAGAEYLLTLRVGAGSASEPRVREAMNAHLLRSRLISTATARQGAAFERVYAVGLQDEARAEALVIDLNGIEGVQGVELRRA